MFKVPPFISVCAILSLTGFACETGSAVKCGDGRLCLASGGSGGDSNVAGGAGASALAGAGGMRTDGGNGIGGTSGEMLANGGNNGSGGVTVPGSGGNPAGGNGTGGKMSAGMGGTAMSADWSSPTSLIAELGRLAIGNQVHLVGHGDGKLLHRRSADNGVTWSSPTVIGPASANYPAMYGGLFAEGDNVYLLTADVNMDSSAGAGGAQLDFRKSSDNGASWSAPIRLTTSNNPIFRVRIAASGNFVHIAGTSSPTTDASEQYFRSVDGGVTWKPTVVLAMNLGKYGGGQTVAVDGAVVHVAYTKVVNGVGGGPTQYVRSMDNGATWSAPIAIGENTTSSSRQARVQLSAADGRVFACWQREASMTGDPVPADRIGFNRSMDGGKTWGTAGVLPEGTGIDRNHQHCFMAPGGGVHVLWRNGDSGDNTPDAAWYMHSPDYGATWRPQVVAIDTTAKNESNHPWNIVANATAVHIVTGPETKMLYAFRKLK